MHKKLVKPKVIKAANGQYNLNCSEYKKNISKQFERCCKGCHNNLCSLWSIRLLSGVGFMVCCSINKVCIKRKYSV